MEARNTRAPSAGMLGPLAAIEIDKKNRQSQSLQTMMFTWHCWLDILNRNGQGNAGQLKYSTLPRMELIPLYAHPVADIQAGGGGFSYGGQMGDFVKTDDGKNDTGFGSYGGTGKSRVTSRSMLAHESRAFIEKNYGAQLDRPGAAGCLVLDSLTSDQDEAKLEAFMLYAAVMENLRPLGGSSEGAEAFSMRGVDVLIQDLPAWLTHEAPLMLDYCIKNGVDYQPSSVAIKIELPIPAGHYELAASARRRGLKMIEEIMRNASIAVRLATDATRGILAITKGQISSAKMGMKDTKARADGRDIFLMDQFPEYPMDTEMDRARMANQPLAESIARSGEGNSQVMQAMLMQNQLMLEEMRAMRTELNDAKTQLANAEGAKSPQGPKSPK